MAWRMAKSLLCESLKCLRNKDSKVKHFRMFCSHSPEESSEEVSLPSEWYEEAYQKLTNLAHLLKDVDLINGRLVNIHDNHRVHDAELVEKKHAFVSLAGTFVGSPAVQKAMMKNVMAAGCALPICFTRSCERKPITLNSLTKVSNILNLSSQQRKLVRITICSQVTQHKIWVGALMELLTGLRSEIEYLVQKHPNKDLKMGQQIVATCLKFLDTAISYDPEASSWMRVSPTKVAHSDATHKWEDVLEMFIDLVNCLIDEKELVLQVTKLEIMKEGLHQIRDILIDRSIGFKENRHQESLVQKKLTKTLGHPSRCLFTLLLYYLYESIYDIEVEMSGGVYPVGKRGENNFCLCMGKFLISDKEIAVWSAVKQLDRALGLLKFVWQMGKVKGDLKLQGHLWCIGAQNKQFTYRGSTYFLHGVS